MNKKNLDQALAALSDALTSHEPESLLNNPAIFVEKLPKRSLSGDHIVGGKIIRFASAGITDNATKEQITIKDDDVHIKGLSVDNFNSNLNVIGNVTANKITVDVLEAKEIKADIKVEKPDNLVLSGANKGILWTGVGSTKQLSFQQNPDRIFSSEVIDVQQGKHFSVNGVKVLDGTELGSTVSKSNLREVGRLKGLIVDGSVSINQYLYYNASADRLGLGTEEPNAALSIAEDMIEVMLGTKEHVKGMVGTFAGHGFDIVTDNTSRISIESNGNIQLGNKKQPPVQVNVHGKLAVKVNMPDPDVDLHVAGAVKFNNKLQRYDVAAPTEGSYNVGDIIWNAEPKLNLYVGWICLVAGNPGTWAPFGKIGN